VVVTAANKDRFSKKLSQIKYPLKKESDLSAMSMLQAKSFPVGLSFPHRVLANNHFHIDKVQPQNKHKHPRVQQQQ
jgi:hypothetical protein